MKKIALMLLVALTYAASLHAAESSLPEIFQIIYTGDVEKVKEHLAEYPESIYDKDRCFTPVHQAALVGSVAILKVLVAAGGDPNLDVSYTPLELAFAFGHKKAAEYLVTKDAYHIDYKRIDTLRKEQVRKQGLLKPRAAWYCLINRNNDHLATVALGHKKHTL